MTKLLLVLSKDPFTTEIPDLVIDIANEAKTKGADVSLYLIEDGVTAARNHEYGQKLALSSIVASRCSQTIRVCCPEGSLTSS